MKTLTGLSKKKRSKLNREKGSELLDAAVSWATGKSKALKYEIEDLHDEISTHEETIERLQDKIQTMQNNHHSELMKLEAKHQSDLTVRMQRIRRKQRGSKTAFRGRTRLSAVSVSSCSKQATSSARR